MDFKLNKLSKMLGLEILNLDLKKVIDKNLKIKLNDLFVENKVLVNMPGGFLKVEITSNAHIFMTGGATKVFEGKLNFEDLRNV